MKKNKHVIAAVVVTYLVMSFLPQLGLLSFAGGLGIGGKKKPGAIG